LISSEIDPLTRVIGDIEQQFVFSSPQILPHSLTYCLLFSRSPEERAIEMNCLSLAER
jgi:hypothetical protein